MRPCAALKRVWRLSVPRRQPKRTLSARLSYSNCVHRLADSQDGTLGSEIVANRFGERISYPAFAILISDDESVLVASIRERDRYGPRASARSANKWRVSSRPRV